MIIILPLALCLISFCMEVAYSQDIHVSAEVSPQQIHLDERSMLRVTISGKTRLKQLQPPQLELSPEFIVSYNDLSNQYQWNGDQISPSLTWSYELIPQKVGQFTLTGIRIPYGGKTYAAPPLYITILPSTQEPTRSKRAPNSFTDAFTKAIHKVSAFVDNPHPYVNEQITYTFRYLYTARLPSLDSPTYSLPSLTGFWTKKLPKPPKKTEVIDGTEYWVVEVEVALFPIAAGKTRIEPTQLTLPVGDTDTPKILATDAIEIAVRPLPQMEKPPNFTGAVGEYQIDAKVDRSTVEAGSGFTLWLQVSGVGYFEKLKPPISPPIPDATIYHPKVTDKIDEIRSKVWGSRTYEYVIIPSKSGRLTIPEIEYPYFHPQKRRYQIARTDAIEVTVLSATTTDSQFMPSERRDSISENSTNRQPLYKRISFWVTLLLLTAAVLGVWGYRRQSAKSIPNSLQPRNAATDALEAINQAAALIRTEKASSSEFFTAIANSLYRYIGNRLNISAAGLDPERVRQQCKDANISESATKQLVEVLMQCDYARFAPVSVPPDNIKNTLKHARAVIHAIEKEWNSEDDRIGS